MIISQVRFLIENGVKLQFIATPAPMGFLGYQVMLNRGGDLLSQFEPLSTARKPDEPRIFKNLNAVASLLMTDFRHDFTVVCPENLPK